MQNDTVNLCKKVGKLWVYARQNEIANLCKKVGKLGVYAMECVAAWAHLLTHWQLSFWNAQMRADYYMGCSFLFSAETMDLILQLTGLECTLQLRLGMKSGVAGY